MVAAVGGVAPAEAKALEHDSGSSVVAQSWGETGNMKRSGELPWKKVKRREKQRMATEQTPSKRSLHREVFLGEPTRGSSSLAIVSCDE